MSDSEEPAGDRPKQATHEQYHLSCTDCAYETTIDGDGHEAIELAWEHQENNGGPSIRHFVEFQPIGTDDRND